MRKSSNNRQITEAEMATAFKNGVSWPPLEFRLKAQPKADRSWRPDALLEARWEKQTYEFIAEFKARSTPKAFQEAVQQIESYATQTTGRPMIVLPYLRPSQLAELQSKGISGIDLSGNGIVIVPDRLFVFRTGNPSKYRESVRKRFAYRGTASLVARVFLCRTSFESLADIQDEIENRGGRASLSTISKVLGQLAEDVIVEKSRGEIRLLQPDALLDKLVASYQPSPVRRKVQLATNLPLDQLLSARPPTCRLVISGRSLISRYTGMGSAEPPILYVTDLSNTLKSWSNEVREDSRFPDFELWESPDLVPHFDSRLTDGLPLASPVQAYLECAAGEKREKEAAAQLRERILQQISLNSNGQ